MSARRQRRARVINRRSIMLAYASVPVVAPGGRAKSRANGRCVAHRQQSLVDISSRGSSKCIMAQWKPASSYRRNPAAIAGGNAARRGGIAEAKWRHHLARENALYTHAANIINASAPLCPARRRLTAARKKRNHQCAARPRGENKAYGLVFASWHYFLRT